MTRDRSTVRTGIVGLGNIGQYHAQRLLDIGVTLVGGVDIDPRARERFESRYDVPTYDRGEPLYEDADAVVVTTPNEYHEPYAVEALERDIHVLLEKPLAHTVDSADRIVAAEAASDAFCMVGFNNRFSNTAGVVRDRIERGELGVVRHVEANYVRRRGVPGRGTWFTHQERAGGGALIDLGVHAIDLALYLLGFPTPSVVLGMARSDFGRRDDYVFLEMWGEDAGGDAFDVDDSASAFVRTDGDQTISLEVAWATNRPATHEFVVHGTKAAARFDLIDHELTIHRARTNGPAALEDTSVRTRDVDTHREEQQAFFDAILDDVDVSNVDQALTVQRVIQAIYRSSERGDAVSIE